MATLTVEHFLSPWLDRQVAFSACKVREQTRQPPADHTAGNASNRFRVG